MFFINLFVASRPQDTMLSTEDGGFLLSLIIRGRTSLFSANPGRALPSAHGGRSYTLSRRASHVALSCRSRSENSTELNVYIRQTFPCDCAFLVRMRFFYHVPAILTVLNLNL